LCFCGARQHDSTDEAGGLQQAGRNTGALYDAQKISALFIEAVSISHFYLLQFVNKARESGAH
jgi:hypothetical protein